MRGMCARLLLSLGLLVVGASPALACLNDRESKKSEREFKSSYQEFKSSYQEPQAEPSPETSSGDFWVTKLPAGAGIVLLVGGVVLGLTRSRRP